MYTGIVQGIGEITSIEDNGALRRISVKLPREARGGVKKGASISIDGVCLTVVRGKRTVLFDVMKETLDLTTLGERETGDSVNVERSYKIGDEVGGHILSGHISGTAEVMRAGGDVGAYELRLRAPQEFLPYIFEKGFIGVDGASLTVSNVDGQEFSVWLIPETLSLTTLGALEAGDRVNIEIDKQTQAIVDTVKQMNL